MDTYIENGIKPLLELGFMPEKLKTGDEAVFYWKGNVILLYPMKIRIKSFNR